MNLFSDYENAYNSGSVIPQQSDRAEILFFANLIPKPSSTVADIGCAEGRLVEELAKRGHQVTGVDIAKRFLQQTSQRAKKANVTIKTIEADIEKTIKPFRNETFDYIYLNDIIEHFRNPVAALHNIRSLLHENSTLYIHTPNCACLARITWYLFHPKKRKNFFDPALLGDFHFSTYDQMTLEKTLNFCGFKVNRMIPTQFTSLGIHRIRKIVKFLPHKMAQLFPHLADTLLFDCSICQPIDLEKQISFWQDIYKTN